MNRKISCAVIIFFAIVLCSCGGREKTEISSNSMAFLVNAAENMEIQGISCNVVLSECTNREVEFLSDSIEKWIRYSLRYDIDDGERITQEYIKEMTTLSVRMKTQEDIEEVVFLKEDMEQLISVDTVIIEVEPDVTQECITGYENLKYLPNLKEIYIKGGRIEDFSFLTECREIQVVTIFDYELPEGFLNDCQKLERVQLFGCTLSESLLQNCPSMKVLCVSECEIADADIFSHLVTLEEIQMDETGLCNLNFIRKMKDLRSISVRGNQIRDITPILELQHLEKLWINDNELAAFDINKLPDSLVWLAIAGNNEVEILPENFERFAVMELEYDHKESLGVYENELEQTQEVFDLASLEGKWSEIEAEGVWADTLMYEEMSDDLTFEIEGCISGDIDGNATEDLGVVVAGVDGDGIIMGRWIYIYPREGENYGNPYLPIALSLPVNAGAAWDDSISGILIADGKLIIQDVSGTSNSSYTTEVYSYDGKHWERKMCIQSNFSFVSDGIIQGIYDYEKRWMKRYMIGRNEDGIYEKVQTGNHSFDENPYIGMPVFSMEYTDFSVHHELYEAPFTTTQALEAAVETHFTGCQMEKRQNNPEYVESYEQILGIDIPDYYYIIQKGDKELAIHFEDWTGMDSNSEAPMYEIVAEVYDAEKNAVTEKEESYIYNSQTGKELINE